MKITTPKFDEQEIKMVNQCLQSGWVTQGPLTAEFEKKIGKLHHSQFNFATTSCTAALHLSTMALGLGIGDEVLVPAFTWVTTAHSVEYVGAKAVFVDVDAHSFNIHPEAIEDAITPNTRAIIVVHLFGLAANMAKIKAIASKHQLAVIEDAACAIGTHYKGYPVGTLGDIGCFSFHPRKIITTGEGGMVTTNREDLALCIKRLRNHGATGISSPALEPTGPWTMGRFDYIGYNMRMSDIQAAIGLAQMEKLERLLQERHAAALRYSVLMAEIDEIILPTEDIDSSDHTFQSYVIRIKKGGREFRNEIMTLLEEHDIQTRPGTHAVHRLGYYQHKYKIKPEEFPIAAQSEDCSITLPLFPDIVVEEQTRVVNLIKKAITKRACKVAC